MELSRIDVPSGRMTAALAAPRDEGRRPALIVIHEIAGLNHHVRTKAQRLADMGYVALAPDLYSTRGPRPICVVRTMFGLQGGKGPVFKDLDVLRTWLSRRPEVDSSRIGVVGFCLGGGIALLFAARAELGAAAVFYGSVPKNADAIEDVCPVLGSFGGRDKVFGKGGQRLESHLTALQKPHDVKTYPDAGHSFMTDRGQGGLLNKLNAWGPMKVGYNAEAAEDSWQRIETFFAEHLGAESPAS